MKNFLLLSLLTLTSICYSQEEIYSVPTEMTDCYIGSIKNFDYYISKINTFSKNKNISVFYRDGNEVKNSGVIEIPSDETSLEVFTYEEVFYVLVEKTIGDSIIFYLKKYNSSFEHLESANLLAIEKNKKDSHEVLIKIKDNFIGIVALSNNKKIDIGYCLVYSIENKEKSYFELNIPDLAYYTCEDFIFNNSLQISLILTFYCNDSLSSKHKRNHEAILVSCSNSQTKIFTLEVKQNASTCKSFKFYEIDNTKYFVGSLVFEKNHGENIMGYSVLKNEFGNENVGKVNIILNNKLEDPSIWSGKEFMLLKNNRYFVNSAKQKLKKIIFSEIENKYLFISECQYYLSGGSIGDPMGFSNNANSTVSLSTIPGSPTNSSSIALYSRKDFNMNNLLGDIITSALDSNLENVVWCNKTLNRNVAFAYHVINDLEKESFLINLNTNLQFFFCLQASLFDEEGYFSTKTPLFLAEKNTITTYSINLSTGKSETKPLSLNYSSLPIENIFLFSVKSTNNQLGSFISFQSKGYKPDKIRFIDFK